MIHYFYLVAFDWMLFEGVYLYLMVVKVFNTVVKMKIYYAFSWGKIAITAIKPRPPFYRAQIDVLPYIHYLGVRIWANNTNFYHQEKDFDPHKSTVGKYLF